MFIILFVVVMLVACCVITVCVTMPAEPQKALPWKAPAELHNEDRAWLNSQFILAGAEHLEIPVGIAAKIENAPSRSGVARGNMWNYNPSGKRTYQHNNRGPKPRSQAEMYKVAGYLKNLEATRGVLKQYNGNEWVTIPTAPVHDPVTDTYRFGSKRISAAIYHDMVLNEGVDKAHAILSHSG